jgi:predicted dehydrogenase
MGARHLRGYVSLEQVRPGSLRLRAVCDPRPEAAERVAAGAEELLGYRPRTCASAEEALAAEPGILAADVVTEPRTHVEVILPLLEAGVHVQVEKPLAVTAARGRALAEGARRFGRTLAVAENYRRDPMNRLLRHVIASGAIGTPNLMLEVHVGSGERVMVSPWRHDWSHGGLALDVGVHYADMLEYLLGPIETVYARGGKICETREWTPPGSPPQVVPVECDDLYSAALTFASGAQGVWIMHFGSRGETQWQRTVHGDAGTVSGPPDRTGRPVRLQRGKDALEGEALVAELPGFRLGDVESRFFGDRPAGADLPFPEMDRRLLAIETADFLDAITEGREPEVNAEWGLRSVAVVMALLESTASGLPVRVSEVLSGEVDGFQRGVVG